MSTCLCIEKDLTELIWISSVDNLSGIVPFVTSKGQFVVFSH